MKSILLLVLWISGLYAFPSAYDCAIVKAQCNEWDKSRDVLSSLVVDQPDRADLLYDAGVASFKAGDVNQSIAYFERACDCTDDVTIKQQAYFNTGNAYAHTKQYALALDAYKQVLSLNPEHEKAQYNYEIVKKLMEEEKEEQQQEQQQDQDQQQDQQDNSQQKDNSDSSDTSKNNQDNNNKDQSSDNNQSSEDTSDKNQNNQQNDQQDSSDQENQQSDNGEQSEDQPPSQENQDESDNKSDDTKSDSQDKQEQQSNEQQQQNQHNESNQNKNDQSQNFDKPKQEQQTDESQPQQPEQSEQADNEQPDEQQGTQAVGAPIHEALEKEENQWIVSLLDAQEMQDNRGNKQLLRARLKEGATGGQNNQHNW